MIANSLQPSLPMEGIGPYARPFLKWAGGKTQLIEQIVEYLPKNLCDGRIRKYAEPFIGGGAIFFYIAQKYPISEFYICDRNKELVLAYRTIKEHVEDVIDSLQVLQSEYFGIDPARREEYFYLKRDTYNAGIHKSDTARDHGDDALHTALLIFLNRTCFNGLFRVNSKGKFNVPFGYYSNPAICDANNLRNVAHILQRAIVDSGDFEKSETFVDSRTFSYFDPPYRPISKTASFTSYSKDVFDDLEQERLARYFRKLDMAGAKLMLSNSDPQNIDPDDDFFLRLYDGFTIRKLVARRAINSNGAKRGSVTELLITNY